MAFVGTSTVQTSTANQEIIPVTPSDWKNVKLTLYKMSFVNLDPCQIKINNGNPIYLDTEQGFESDRYDEKIESFVIVTGNVRYSWIGAY